MNMAKTRACTSLKGTSGPVLYIRYDMQCSLNWGQMVVDCWLLAHNTLQHHIRGCQHDKVNIFLAFF